MNKVLEESGEEEFVSFLEGAYDGIRLIFSANDLEPYVKRWFSRYGLEYGAWQRRLRELGYIK